MRGSTRALTPGAPFLLLLPCAGLLPLQGAVEHFQGVEKAARLAANGGGGAKEHGGKKHKKDKAGKKKAGKGGKGEQQQVRPRGKGRAKKDASQASQLGRHGTALPPALPEHEAHYSVQITRF